MAGRDMGGSPSWENEAFTVTRRDVRVGQEGKLHPSFLQRKRVIHKKNLHRDRTSTTSQKLRKAAVMRPPHPDPLASRKILLLCAGEGNPVIVSRNSLKPTENFLQTQKQRRGTRGRIVPAGKIFREAMRRQDKTGGQRQTQKSESTTRARNARDSKATISRELP